ncbi:MAG: hypothetical protein ABI588_01715 [Arenimonas sp.]
MVRSRLFLFMLVLLGPPIALAAERLRLVSESDLADKWIPAPGSERVLVDSVPVVAAGAREACVNLGYLIGPEGTTSRFTEMRSWTSASSERQPESSLIQPFVQVAAAAVSGWRFVPAGRKASPVYTSVTFVFTDGDASSRERVLARCRIDNLQAFVDREARQEGRDSAKNRRDYERGLERGIGCSSFSSACAVNGSDH